jgi:two-component sensor histidine kinase
VWPVLGHLLHQSRTQVLEEGRTIHAEIRGSVEEGYEFAISLTPCGEDQILAVVRNQSAQRALRDRDQWQAAAFTHSPVGILRLDTRGLVANSNAATASLLGEEDAVLAGTEFNEFSLPPGVTSEFLALEHEGKPRGSLVFVQSTNQGPSNASPAAVPPSEATAAPTRERRQHSFRNQLQLVTSLFSLEPQSAAAREAFIKWQVRLRSMALACPYDDTSSVWVFPLLRDLADEVCSLAGRGPGRREVIITGDEALTLDVQTAAPFSLLIGELMRLVLGARQHGPGPELYVNLRPHPGGGFQLTVRPGMHRSFVFIDRDSEVETLELLTEQIQGRLEPTDPGNPAKEWVLIVPQTRS